MIKSELVARLTARYPHLYHRDVERIVTTVLDNVTKAINILVSAHGAGSFAETNPLQRIWRDSAVAARNAVTLPMPNYEIYGKALLGRDDQITPFI